MRGNAPEPGRTDAARLAAIVESSSEAIIGSTVDGVITSWNGAAERLYGYTAEEAVGRNVSIIAPPGRRGEQLGMLARIAAGERVPHLDTVRVRKDGSRVDVTVAISPIHDDFGTVVGSSSVAHETLEPIGAIVSEIAHELNNLLMIVQLAVSDIERRGHPADAASFVVIRDAVQQSSALTRRLLALDPESDR